MLELVLKWLCLQEIKTVFTESFIRKVIHIRIFTVIVEHPGLQYEASVCWELSVNSCHLATVTRTTQLK